MTREEILQQFIYPALEEIAPTLDKPASVSCSPDTALFGADGALNSLNLVTLIVSVEERVEAGVGKNIRIVSEKAMSRKHSPFRSADTLAAFIGELLEEHANG